MARELEADGGRAEKISFSLFCFVGRLVCRFDSLIHRMNPSLGDRVLDQSVVVLLAFEREACSLPRIQSRAAVLPSRSRKLALHFLLTASCIPLSNLSKNLGYVAVLEATGNLLSSNRLPRACHARFEAISTCDGADLQYLGV